jgi:hypothetical protein
MPIPYRHARRIDATRFAECVDEPPDIGKVVLRGASAQTEGCEAEAVREGFGEPFPPLPRF